MVFFVYYKLYEWSLWNVYLSISLTKKGCELSCYIFASFCYKSTVTLVRTICTITDHTVVTYKTILSERTIGSVDLTSCESKLN